MLFTKMHGIGNDYVYINCFVQDVLNPSALAVKMSDRHFGVGSDGIVLICPSTAADFKMEMYNADGSQSEMCGNATRCIGKYVYEKGLTAKEKFTLETLAGIKTLHLHIKDGKVDAVTVDMGAPEYRPEKIPMAAGGEEWINQPAAIDGRQYNLTAVSMGNPHAVVYMEDIEGLDIEGIGPKFEHAPLFPNRVNTEFVKVVDRTHVKMRVWERGTGETLACGTGACAVLAACVKNNLTEKKIEIQLLGGKLTVELKENGHIHMTGPAAFVFEGEWPE